MQTRKTLITLLMPCLALCASAQASEGDTWLNLSLASTHFAQRYDEHGQKSSWQETNPGIGIERGISERVSLIAGAYHNSMGRTSIYAGASTQLLEAGPLALGAQAVLVTGYPLGKAGATATATLKLDGWRLQIIAAPGINKRSTGFAAIQIGLSL